MFSLGQLKSEDNNNDRMSKVILLTIYGVCEWQTKSTKTVKIKRKTQDLVELKPQRRESQSPIKFVYTQPLGSRKYTWNWREWTWGWTLEPHVSCHSFVPEGYIGQRVSLLFLFFLFPKRGLFSPFWNLVWWYVWGYKVLLTKQTKRVDR